MSQNSPAHGHYSPGEHQQHHHITETLFIGQQFSLAPSLEEEFDSDRNLDYGIMDCEGNSFVCFETMFPLSKPASPSISELDTEASYFGDKFDYGEVYRSEIEYRDGEGKSHDDVNDEGNGEVTIVKESGATVSHEGPAEAPWSPEEDSKLVDFLRLYNCWRMVYPMMPGRSQRSCCERWYNHLATADGPQTPKGLWMPDEVALLTEQRAKGISYRTIADQLPGRSERACRKYVSQNSVVKPN
jgi:hypothetical protein